MLPFMNEALAFAAEGAGDPKSVPLERLKLMLGSAHCAALSQFRAQSGA